MKRTERASVAQQTLLIIERGQYVAADGTTVELRRDVEDAIATSRLFGPMDQRRVLREASQALEGRGDKLETQIEVSGETTLEAAFRLYEGDPRGVMALNFASAKNAGGGFLKGSQAQEESLARSSALYATLTANPGYYDANRRHRSALYTDHVIVSPDVPVFRDDEGALVPEPRLITFITAPAVNAGVVRSRDKREVSEIRPTMERRIAYVLALSVLFDCRRLVLGAWGCGVFQNDPELIAELFDEALRGDFAGAFEEVVFAVYDRTRDQACLRAFVERFEPGAEEG